MALAKGARLGAYEITGLLGVGGMGEVYRAEDTKLKRAVAIKLLPDSVAGDADRLARFQREAQVLASLNHPNIAAIYGLEENALVMELVEGETLKGPLPVETAVSYARQLAEALEYAHEKSIVHRDLKPDNVKITPEGQVKVLDFGLAKSVEQSAASGEDARSQTMTMGGATQAGMILGTAAYMAPEQARGHNVDKRADIWSFGVVVYELITGKQLFEGPTLSDTLASVLRHEPDLSLMPVQLRRMVRVCLVRDVRHRMRDIGDARLLLDDPEPAQSIAPIRSSKMPWAVAAATAVALAVTGALLWNAPKPVERPLVRVSVDLGPDAVPETNVTAALSPDGTRLAYVARSGGGPRQIVTRLLGQRNTVALAGTDNPTNFFFSPDGQWIGFISEQMLRKVPAEGGAVVTLCDVPQSRGASWGEDNHIAVTAGRRLLRVPAAGGKPEELPPSALPQQRTPQVLPGGQAILYTASGAGVSYENARIEVLSLKTRQTKVVATDGYFGRYLPSGHLIFVRQGVLLAQRFDLASLEAKGVPVPVVEDLAASPTTGMGQYEFSTNGTLVYLTGSAILPGSVLAWVDRAGKTEPIPIPLALNSNPRLSPDGRRLILSVGTSNASDLWSYEFDRENFSRFTLNRNGNSYAVWAPDGKHVVYVSQESGSSKVWWARADGGGEPRLLLESKARTAPTSFSPDGRRLAFSQLTEATTSDVWTMPVDTTDPEHPKAGQQATLLRSHESKWQGVFSPDGKWIAHGGMLTSRNEVYVRPFPAEGGRWLISNGGGDYPVWSRDGRTLLYLAPDGRIMEVDYQAKGDSFLPGKPRPWTTAPIPVVSTTQGRQYDVSLDGKRLLIAYRPEATQERKGNLHVTFLFNFFDELKRRVP